MKLELLAPYGEVKIPPAALIEINEESETPNPNVLESSGRTWRGIKVVCSGPGHFEAESIVGGARTKLMKQLEREPTAQELVAELTSGKHGSRLRTL
jgi:hypothetical protein